MAKQKNTMISVELLKKLLRYFNFGNGESDDSEEANEIRKLLNEKLEAAKMRSLYSSSKDKNLTPEQREAARQAYLDEKGYQDEYRWSQETAERYANGDTD